MQLGHRSLIPLSPGGRPRCNWAIAQKSALPANPIQMHAVLPANPIQVYVLPLTSAAAHIQHDRNQYREVASDD
jgi:hypothetical protein